MEDEIIVKRVRELRAQMPRIGTRKLYHLLQQTLRLHRISIGRDGLFNLLANYGLLVRRRKRTKACTTDSNHRFKKYPNLVTQLDINSPGQVWVSDITYIHLPEDFCYLSLITDAYSRKIVGYNLYPTLHTQGPYNALQMALFNTASRTSGLIHHSDRGTQYCSETYTRMLQNETIGISMTENGDPYENAIAERVNGILKTEFDLDRPFESYQAASAAVDQAVHVYNQQRPHSSCDYLTPDQAHQTQGKLKHRWKKR